MNFDKLAAAAAVLSFVAATPAAALADHGADDPAAHARDDHSGAAGLATAAPRTANTLRGSVGPGHTITLTENGHRVRSLRPGTYRFVIADRAPVHDFVLEQEHGGRFERELTDVGDVGTKTVVVRLTRGAWKYYCEPHESMMFGKFTVE